MNRLYNFRFYGASWNEACRITAAGSRFPKTGESLPLQNASAWPSFNQPGNFLQIYQGEWFTGFWSHSSSFFEAWKSAVFPDPNSRFAAGYPGCFSSQPSPFNSLSSLERRGIPPEFILSPSCLLWWAKNPDQYSLKYLIWIRIRCGSTVSIRHASEISPSVLSGKIFWPVLIQKYGESWRSCGCKKSVSENSRGYHYSLEFTGLTRIRRNDRKTPGRYYILQNRKSGQFPWILGWFSGPSWTENKNWDRDWFCLNLIRLILTTLIRKMKNLNFQRQTAFLPWN